MYAPGAFSAFALGAALGAMTRAPAETVIAPFDLAGWRKSGALTLETPAARGARPEALVDLDPQTAVVVPGESAEFHAWASSPRRACAACPCCAAGISPRGCA
jgi:hypothetical protein